MSCNGEGEKTVVVYRSRALDHHILALTTPVGKLPAIGCMPLDQHVRAALVSENYKWLVDSYVSSLKYADGYQRLVAEIRGRDAIEIRQ